MFTSNHPDDIERLANTLVQQPYSLRQSSAITDVNSSQTIKHLVSLLYIWQLWLPAKTDFDRNVRNLDTSQLQLHVPANDILQPKYNDKDSLRKTTNISDVVHTMLTVTIQPN